MSFRAFRCVLISPVGVQLDVSNRIDIDEAASIELDPESDLTVMNHGDWPMVLDDVDGVVESFLAGAQPSDIYTVILERERAPGGPFWDRVFGGVLDVPTSLHIDDKTKKLEVGAYSFSKGMERVPGTSIATTFAVKTASISAGSQSITLLAGETADLEPGHILRVSDPTQAIAPQDFTVDYVQSSTVVVVAETAIASISSATAVVSNPGYRWRSPAFLAAAIATASGVTLDPSNLIKPLAPYLVATPVSLRGGSLRLKPRSVVPSGTTIIGTFGGGPTNKRVLSGGPQGTWADQSNITFPQGDWTPYLLSEPGSIYASSSGGGWDDGKDTVHNVAGNSTQPYPAGGAWDHAGSKIWGTVISAATDASNNVGAVPVLNGSLVGGLTVASHNIWRWVAGLSTKIDMLGCDWDPANALLWGSLRDTTGYKAIRTFDPVGLTYADVDITRCGQLRTCRYLDRMVLCDVATGELAFYATTGSRVARERFTPPTGDVLLWTLRAWGTHLAFLISRYDGTYIAIYDVQVSSSPTTRDHVFTPAAFYRVSSEQTSYGSNGAFLTIRTDALGAQYGFGFAGSEWFTLGSLFDGVIPAADFSEKSCAAAAKDIALVTGSILHVDNFKVLRLINRNTLGDGAPVADYGAPIERTRQPISDIYRASVEVKGTSQAGAAISEIADASDNHGDSARRLTVTADLVSTPGMALATAASLLAFVSRVRGAESDSVIDEGDPVQPFDKVTVGGRDLILFKLATDLATGTHALDLLEVVS